MKRLLVLTLVLALCVTALAGCGAKKEETVAVEMSYDPDEVVVTVSDREITMDEYRFYVVQASMAVIGSLKPDFDGNFENIDWNEKVDGEKTLTEAIEERTVNDIKSVVAMIELGEKNGVTLAEEDKKQIETMLTQTKESQGEELFNLMIRQMGVSTEENFIKVYGDMILSSKVEEDIGVNRDKYITPELETSLAGYRSNERVTAQHVLIKNDSEKHTDPKAAIDEVHKRALAGEDFNALMKEYNEDPGETEGGYTFGKGEMVPEFEAAAFALEYNAISDIVPSSYGYHVIKRIIGAAEFKSYIEETTEVTVNEDVAAKVSVVELMTEFSNITNEINSKMGGKANG